MPYADLEKRKEYQRVRYRQLRDRQIPEREEKERLRIERKAARPLKEERVRRYYQRPEIKEKYKLRARVKRANMTPEQKQAYRNKQRQFYLSLKAQAVSAYGGKCACCGEANLAFLTIDHKNNDGHKHRRPSANSQGRTSGGGGTYYSKLKRQSWPDYVRVLCYNCNCGRAFANRGGECPHKTADIRGILMLQSECFT